jgi:hypothetical protein
VPTRSFALVCAALWLLTYVAGIGTGPAVGIARAAGSRVFSEVLDTAVPQAIANVPSPNRPSEVP